MFISATVCYERVCALYLYCGVALWRGHCACVHTRNIIAMKEMREKWEENRCCIVMIRQCVDSTNFSWTHGDSRKCARVRCTYVSLDVAVAIAVFCYDTIRNRRGTLYLAGRSNNSLRITCILCGIANVILYRSSNAHRLSIHTWTMWRSSNTTKQNEQICREQQIEANEENNNNNAKYRTHTTHTHSEHMSPIWDSCQYLRRLWMSFRIKCA